MSAGARKESLPPGVRDRVSVTTGIVGRVCGMLGVSSREGAAVDEALLYDLCSRARLVQVRSVGSDAGLRGLTDFIAHAAACSDRYSHEQLLQLIEAAPRPIGFRYGFRRLERISALRTTAPDDLSGEERIEYDAAQAALRRSIGRDSGEPVHGVVGVARNVVEQFVLRWF